MFTALFPKQALESAVGGGGMRGCVCVCVYK